MLLSLKSRLVTCNTNPRAVVTAPIGDCRDTLFAMSYACTTCDAEFSSAASVGQHVALHHSTCAVCDESFDTADDLRDHTHATHQ